MNDRRMTEETGMERICIYPGSFDPITVGHMDIIRRACRIFDRVIVAVLHNPAKHGTFRLDKRLELIRTACADLPTVSVDSFDGLLVDYVRKTGAQVVVRGLRAVTDFEAEFQMAQVNHQVLSDMETLFMMTQPEHAYISSSVVRELAMFGGDITPFVPAEIVDEVRSHFAK